MKYEKLIEEYSEFSFDRFEYEVIDEKLNIKYFYTLKGIDNINFIHKVNYEGINCKLDYSKIKSLENLIFHIGVVETINYYKLACPKTLNIKCGYLSDNQKKWFKKLFYNGLGEFIYVNKLVDLVDEESLVNIVCGDKKYDFIDLDTSGNLIPVGGGKDSVVTLEILKDMDNIPFVMSAPVAAYDTIKVAGYDKYIKATRIFDHTMIDMNAKGYLNGHIPYSAILGFVSVLAASLSHKKYIPLSNEKSANEPSVMGTTFNHQYSKSFEFEDDFVSYVKENLTNDVNYFSLLRLMYEIDIAKLFSNYKKYHYDFRSCNKGSKENIWCCKCGKCLFVYIILTPFLERSELIRIFGSDLLSDKELEPIFKELIGVSEHKPFDCVGTIWEVRYALDKIKNSYKDAYLLDVYKSYDLDVEKSVYETGNHIPLEYRKIVEEEMRKYGVK